MKCVGTSTPAILVGSPAQAVTAQTATGVLCRWYWGRCLTAAQPWWQRRNVGGPARATPGVTRSPSARTHSGHAKDPEAAAPWAAGVRSPFRPGAPWMSRRGCHARAPTFALLTRPGPNPRVADTPAPPLPLLANHSLLRPLPPRDRESRGNGWLSLPTLTWVLG